MVKFVIFTEVSSVLPLSFLLEGVPKFATGLFYAVLRGAGVETKHIRITTRNLMHGHERARKERERGGGGRDGGKERTRARRWRSWRKVRFVVASPSPPPKQNERRR